MENTTSWCDPPAEVAASEDATHLWRLSLSLAPEELRAATSLLTPAERDRAARIAHQPAREAFVACRAALRVILGEYLGEKPRALRVAIGPHGKPFLEGSEELAFSLSHSGDLGLIAVTAGRDLGVDVERIRPTANPDAVAARFFSSKKRRRYEATAAADKQQAFFAVWTEMEAALKARGLGLFHALDTTGGDSRQGGLCPVSFEPEPGYVASVAASNRSPRLAFYRFEWARALPGGDPTPQEARKAPVAERARRV